VPLPDRFSGFPEPQFTRTPNLIFDCLADLTGSQLKVLLYVVRATMGWRKDYTFTPLSITQVQTGTGLSREPVIDALKWLCDSKMVLRQKQRDEDGRQGVTTYRLRFEGDSDEEVLGLEPPESENPTLARVGKLCNFSDSGGGPSFSVFKEKKENTPLPPIVENHNTLETRCPTLDTEETLERHPKSRWPKKAKDPERWKMKPYADAVDGGPRCIPTPQGVHLGVPPPTTPPVDFPARWNEQVPERPTDPALLPSHPAAYREAAFSERFDEICEKAKGLISSGADLTFDFLLSTDPKRAGQYRWQQLLLGSLNWMVPKKDKRAGADFEGLRTWLAAKRAERTDADATPAETPVAR
jgi:hypothetical protein